MDDFKANNLNKKENNIFKKRKVREYKNGDFKDKKDILIRESPLTIFIEGHELLTLLCLKEKTEELITGYLAAEGIIEKAAQIKKIEFKKQKEEAHLKLAVDFKIEKFEQRKVILGSSCGSSFINIEGYELLPKIINSQVISAQKLLNLMKKFESEAVYFKKTGGTHISALASLDKIIFASEDIGRHNTVDKIIGEALINEIELEDKLFFTSGRISSEMIIKIIRQKIPFLISRSAPTEAALNLALDSNLTLIGFCRGRRMNIYSGSKRISD
ncbi:formate dehydrogenase accessory sulfurtransferase FdhD [Halanaerobium sp. Z-7514]|uniref:Sulfur carrier protein FdhD n=1 Tax=Halanaerobium polyolivorans TaxID=2886943 RepID=A0AAW4WWT6_9FIRM|nr:formate dehydrogenase accessory sulfurtransferase FdhD [Halanaerobium polyolivorans]MCC3144341.1 formate dehydrogenase accessory sulfurtransferase FdhD [Halanaerobium polyolivorans]